MASAPALFSFAGQERNNIQDEDGLNCSTVVKFALLGVTVIGLIIWGIAVARRKVELDNLNKQIDQKYLDERTINTTREKLNEALKKQGELSEKVQAEKEKREQAQLLNLEEFKKNKKKELLEARNETKGKIIDHLDYLLTNKYGILCKLSYLVDLCDYLTLSARKKLSKEEQEKSNNLMQRIQNYTFFKDDRCCSYISKENAEPVLNNFISQKLKEEDLYDIAFIEDDLRNQNILMKGDTFDAETFLVEGERNGDYSTLLNEFIKNLGDFDWSVKNKNWQWLKAQATPLMEYLQKEKKHLQGMKEALKGGGIDDNDKELLEAINKYQEENKDEKREKTENEKELEKVQSEIFKLQEELGKLGAEKENIDGKGFGLEKKRDNLGKNLYKPWFLSENYD